MNAFSAIVLTKLAFFSPLRPRWVSATSEATYMAFFLAKKNTPFGSPSVVSSVEYFIMREFISLSSDSSEYMVGKALT